MTSKNGLMIAATAGIALWGSGAIAATVKCPGVNPAGRPTYINLTVPDATTALCYDWGQSTENGNGNYTVVAGVPLVIDNNILELPAGTSTTNVIGSYLSGTFNSGTSGTFNVIAGANGPLWLGFKFGGGQNDPYWFAYSLSALVKDTTLFWQIFSGDSDPANGLSGTRLFGGTPSSGGSTTGGGTTTGGSTNGTQVPEPASSLVLLGLGMLGLGFTRRMKQAA